MDDLSRYQDDIGQLARLKTYTHLLLGFPISNETDRDSIVKALEDAALALTATFPWLAAKVMHEGRTAENSGVFRLKPCPDFAPPNSVVIIQDRSDVCLPYDQIRAAKGPVSMLDGKLLGPVIAFPETYEETKANPARVLVIQANFISGGLLLDVASQHNFIDGGGLFHCVSLLAKLLRGETLSDFEVQQGNRDRRNLIPLLRDDEPMLDHSHLKRPSVTTASTVGKRPPAAWHCFRFPSTKVEENKNRANADLVREAVGEETAQWVSTNDALSAFLWKRLAAVRFQRRGNPDEFTKLSRALDARRAMGIPKEYMGQMGYNATCRVRFGDLDQMSLGATAATLRNKVKEVNTEHSVRSWATFISQEPDKSTIMFGGTFNPDTDVGLSSLAHVELYSQSFGILGKPELVRRPNFSPLEGCVYFWSRTESGDIDVLLCLNEADIEGLKADGEWKDHTEYIG